MAVLLILLEIQTFWEFELHNGVHFVGYICLSVCALLELFSCQQCRLETTQWAVCGNLVMLCLTVSNQSSCLIWQVLAVNKEPSMDTAISIWQQRKLRDQVPTFCYVHHLDNVLKYRVHIEFVSGVFSLFGIWVNGQYTHLFYLYKLITCFSVLCVPLMHLFSWPAILKIQGE